MNHATLIGNLTRDPELTETSGGTKICRFSIAVQRTYSNADGEKTTDFFNIVAWRGLAETAAKYLKKGNKVAVSGSIELRNYEDSQGVKRTGVDIVASDLEFLTPKSNSEDDGWGSRQQGNSDKRTARKPLLEAFDDDSDIPF